MKNIDIDAVTNLIREVAAEYILPRFRNLQAADIAYKIGDDPVTVADKEAEKALSPRLLGLLPGSKVVGEEAFAVNSGVFESFSGESPVWIIDPVDGTRNFVAGNPEFGVIVALAEQNQVLAGWIYNPTSDEVLTAEKGSGAYYKGQKLKVSPARAFPQMSGFLGDRLLEFYEKAKGPKDTPPVFETMVAGAHEYPRLVLDTPHFGKNKPQAQFRASAFYSTPWDDAAGVLIHREAGGYSAFWDGSAYRPSVMHQGLALAPDKDSWEMLRAWCRSFTDLQ
ncbi:MAG: inositol monophosphatase [Alphaproteobacteria bacterium]|nr:inositol monophosphatase [Alphaproteobacteria bacterium]